MQLTIIIILTAGVSFFAGMYIMHLISKETNNIDRRQEEPKFDEADIYHTPKYYPRVTKEQEQ